MSPHFKEKETSLFVEATLSQGDKKKKKIGIFEKNNYFLKIISNNNHMLSTKTK